MRKVEVRCSGARRRLATIAAAVYPFSTGAPLAQKMATAVVNLALGFAIGTLLTAVAARAVHREIQPPADSPYEHDQDDHPPTLPIDYPSRASGN